VAAERLLDGEAEAITRRAIDEALRGDVAALKLCLDRITPPRRDRPVMVPIMRIGAISDLPGAVADIVAAVARGDLTPAEGEAIVRLLDRWRAAVETSELSSRVAALEARDGAA
jgi:hypothetical protein